MPLSRRQLVLGAGGLALAGRAQAQTAERPAIVLVYFDGGYNAFFSAADGYVSRGLYGCTTANVRALGNDVVVDASTIGALPDPLLQRMATVGVNHRASGHDFALQYAWFDRGRSVPLMLADALGGTAPFRCVHFGQAPARGAPHRAYNGVAMTAVPDLSAAIALVSNDVQGPSRPQMAKALEASLAYGGTRYQHSPTSLRKEWEGTHSLIRALQQPVPPGIDWPEIATAYGINPMDTSALSFTAHLAGAELMLRAGADVVCVTSGHVKVGAETKSWDTHGDGTGELARTMMRTAILPSLTTFLQRTLAMQGRNVITLLWGDFARIGGNTPSASEHANGVSATVFGKSVRPGTTGRFEAGQNALYALPTGTPGYPGLWAYLTALAGVGTTPWGANPHTRLI
jgi:hypothetical protein